MEITQIKVFPVDEDKLKAFVTIVLDNCFVIRDIKVIRGADGLFVAMPSKQRKDGTFRDIAHPVNQTTRDFMARQIIDSYLAEMAAGTAGPVSLEARHGSSGATGGTQT